MPQQTKPELPVKSVRGGHSRLKRWALIVACAIALALLIGGWLLHSVLPYTILRPNRFERWTIYHGCTPAQYGLDARNIFVQVEPDLWLHGWFVRAANPGKGTVILLHGSSSCKEAMLGLAKLLVAQNYNCLLYDSRAHGESGGEYCTFGYYERRDCSCVIDEAERQFGSLGPIAIFGNSLGGAIALQTMAGDPRICCGVVESPFATMREVVRDYMQHYSGIPFVFISNLALARAAEIAHFSVDEVSPEEAASHIQRPVLVLHGTQDHWIDFKQGQRVASHLTAPGSRFVPIVGADHDNLWRIGGPEYQRMVLDFLAVNLH